MTGADKAQLRQVRAAILGNRPDTSLSSTLYPVYVAVIAAGTYGVPASQQLFRSLDEKWLAEHAWTPVGAIVAVTVVSPAPGPGPAGGAGSWSRGATAALPRAGRHQPHAAQGHARPALAAESGWVHHRRPAGRCLVGGAGLAIANVASPVVLLPATLGGALLGVLVAELWLQGQLHGQFQAPSLGARPGSSLLGGRRNALALLGHHRSAETGREQCHHGRSRPRRGSAHGPSRRRATHDARPTRAVESQRATGGDRPP